jgi:hypothetical protein
MTIGDDMPGGFSPRADLPPVMAANLKWDHQRYLDRGDTATALVLARLAASEAAKKLRKDVEREDRRTGTEDIPRKGPYWRPTVLVGIWRDPDLQPELRRLLRKALAIRQSGIAWEHLRTWLESAACHERWEREFIIAHLLAKLAEWATRPDEGTIAEIEREDRAFAKTRDAAEVLDKAGHPDEAAELTQRAVKHLWRAQKLAREWSPNATELIRKVHASSWQIGFLGYGIIAELVAAALNRPISRGQVRYVKITPGGGVNKSAAYRKTAAGSGSRSAPYAEPRRTEPSPRSNATASASEHRHEPSRFASPFLRPRTLSVGSATWCGHLRLRSVAGDFASSPRRHRLRCWPVELFGPSRLPRVRGTSRRRTQSLRDQAASGKEGRSVIGKIESIRKETSMEGRMIRPSTLWVYQDSSHRTGKTSLTYQKTSLRQH